MRNLISLRDLSLKDISEIFQIADAIEKNEYQNLLTGKAIVMFFPNSSIRTRVTFEKGIGLLGGQTILFPPETLDKREAIEDVVGYLNHWVDAVIVRYKNIELLYEATTYAKFPIINAMTDLNHPCEILSDMYALSKKREDFKTARYLFVGAKGNIGLAWKEAADVFNLDMRQCCPKGYEMQGMEVVWDIHEAISGTDIVCTDSIPDDALEAFRGYQITPEIMRLANRRAIANPCPPFYRGEEVSADLIKSEYFVGYEFKKYLLQIQQAVLIFCLTH